MVTIELNEYRDNVFAVNFDTDEYISEDLRNGSEPFQIAYYVRLFENASDVSFVEHKEMIFSEHYAYTYNGIPFSMVVDPDDKVISHFTVDNPSDREAIAEMIKNLIEASK